MRARPSAIALALTAALAAVLLGGCAARAGGIHARMGYSEQRGLRVVDVPRDGPAWRAGLRPDDRIVSVDGAPVRHLPLTDIVRRLRGPVGSTVELKVARDGEMHELTVRRAPYR